MKMVSVGDAGSGAGFDAGSDAGSGAGKRLRSSVGLSDCGKQPALCVLRTNRVQCEMRIVQ